MAEEKKTIETGTENHEKTFTQAELDNIVNNRLAREREKMPSADELNAFRAWKDSQQSEEDRRKALEKERDDAKTGLAAAKTELEQMKREKTLLNKGVPAEDVDYYAFKIGKLVTDAKPFDKAAEEFFKDNPLKKPKIDLSAPVGGGNGGKVSTSDFMNALIRGKI